MGTQTYPGLGLLQDAGLPDRYRVLQRIARGGMASVWCAHDVLLGRRVAIKLLGEQFADDEPAFRRLEREARAAARLSGHPHVVTIYDVGQTEPRDDLPRRPFIVMEHLAGGTVGDALGATGLAERVLALRWVRGTAAALDFAHGRGVIHRDIKPANLLLDPDHVVHVADFGIARIGTEDSITETGQLFGTAAYLSPEQALGRPATDASDRYALAVVAFELLVGERPFIAQHFAAQARQHIEEQPPRATQRNRALPPAVDRVLARGMAKRPEDRWRTAGAFADALEAALLGRAAARTASVPVTAPTVGIARAARDVPPRTHARAARDVPPRTHAPAAAPARRRPRAAALAALAAAAFTTGAAAGAAGEGTPGHPRRSAHVTSPSKPPAARAPVRPVRHRTTSRPATTTTTTAAPAPTVTTSTPPTADTLEAQGHQLMLAGNYPAAIGALRQAIAAAAPGSLTYAYALFDLGRSLRLGGDPRAAALVLERRLQIPNQTGVVRQELQSALQAIGAQVGASAGPGPGDHGGQDPPGHRHKVNGQGGD